MRNTFIAILMLLASQLALSQNQFTLKEAIDYGLANSNSIKSELINVADADGQILEYKSIGIPKLDFDVSYSYFLDLPTQLLPDFLSPVIYGVMFQEGVIEEREIQPQPAVPVQFGTDQSFTGTIGLETMLFDFAWFKGLKAQQMYRELVRKQVETIEMEVRSNVTKAYLATLIAAENQKLLDKDISNLEKTLNETQLVYESGFAEKLDVDRIELSLENLKIEQNKIGQLIEVSKNLLKFQMGFPIEQTIELTDELEPIIQQTLADNALILQDLDLNQRPEFEVFNRSIELQEINQKVIKYGYLPTFRAFGSYSRTLQRNKLFDENEAPWFPSTVVGLTMNMPIFDGLEKKAKLDRAKLSQQKLELDREEFSRSISLAVQNARVNLSNAKLTLNNRIKSMDLAQRIYDTALIKYREGVGSSIETTQAETQLYRAQNNYLTSLFDLVNARIELEIALGNL